MAKILHLIDSLDAGGMERLVLNLATVQIAQGHNVRVGCLLREGTLAAEARSLGISVISFGKQRGFDFSAISKITQSINEFCPDFIHTHNAVPNYFSALAALFCRRRIDVNTRHDMGEHNANWRLTLLYRGSLLLTRRVATVCEAARNTLARLGQAPLHRTLSIRNGVPIEADSNMTALDRNRLRAELRLDQEAPVVISVGRLTAIKGLDLLVRSFSVVLEQVPNAVLLVVGTGDEEKSLLTLVNSLGISRSVKFLGFRKDTNKLLQIARVFAQTSLSEGYSLALVEACIAGLPIVASEVGGNSEIVFNGRNGALLAGRYPSQFAETITKYLMDGDLHRFASDCSLEWAREHASVDSMADHYWQLYTRVGSR